MGVSLLAKKCAVQGTAGLRRVQLQPGNWFAQPGSGGCHIELRLDRSIARFIQDKGSRTHRQAVFWWYDSTVMWRLLRTLFLTSIWMACVCSVAAQNAPPAHVTQPSRSWTQSGLRWTKPPAELHLKQRSAEAALLYFGPNHEFALVFASVIQGPNSEGVSHGDGRVVYLGTWESESTIPHVEYRLVSRTVAKANETLPGPMQKGDVQVKEGVLLFDKMRFQRDRRLDDDLRTIVQGERGRLAP